MEKAPGASADAGAIHAHATLKTVCHSENLIVIRRATADNTHLLCKGKYHCTDDLLFDWFGLDQTTKFHMSKAPESKQVKHEISCTVILPL